MNYVAIDIHKGYSVLAAQDEEGRKLKEARIEGNWIAGQTTKYFLAGAVMVLWRLHAYARPLRSPDAAVGGRGLLLPCVHAAIAHST